MLFSNNSKVFSAFIRFIYRKGQKEATTVNDIEFERIYDAFSDDVWRVCVCYFGGCRADAEDASQTAFVKLLTNPPDTDDMEHIKAWLIVTAGNVCKDMLRSRHRRSVPLSSLAEIGYTEEAHDDSVLQAVLKLPAKVKTAVYLHYYEGMSGEEIARVCGISTNTVFWYLHKGRKMLKGILESE